MRAESVVIRFLRYIEPQENGCWLWTASKRKDGYGRIRNGSDMSLAHRVSYELFLGPIPEETIDHLCRNRSCVNPDHLESVSHRINILRGNTIPVTIKDRPKWSN